MNGLLLLALISLGLGLLGLAAARFGTDTTPTGDERSTRSW